MPKIEPFYEKRRATMQAAIDLFRGQWKSAFPEASGLQAGEARMFDDPRPSWAQENLPGGLAGKSVLELGPFEGYQTYLLEQLGAGSIVSIEGNSFNFLKCLVVKNALQLRAEYLFGDCLPYLENTDSTFDLCWASGILYHQTKPLQLLELICRKSAAVFVWTHFYDADRMANLERAQRRLFVSKGNTIQGVGDYRCMHYMRTYDIADYDKNIPGYWEGGNEGHAYWLAYDDILEFVKAQGLSNMRVQNVGDVGGLPCVAFLAWR